MIPTIGLTVCAIGWIIGAYVLTRMMAYLTGETKPSVLVIILSIVTILVTLGALVIISISGLDLVVRGTQASELPKW